MKLDFTKLELQDLEGNKGKDANKVLANAIYQHTRDLGLVVIAQDIYNGKEVDISQSQAEEIKRVIQDEKCGFLAFAQKTMLDFIEKA